MLGGFALFLLICFLFLVCVSRRVLVSTYWGHVSVPLADERWTDSALLELQRSVHLPECDSISFLGQ